MMVDTGDFIAEEINNISAVLLGIHTDHRIIFSHIRNVIF